MFEIPPRDTLAVLTDSADAILPTPVVGFVRNCDDRRVLVLFAHRHGISEYRPKAAELVEALLPGPDTCLEADSDAIRANPDRAIEWQLIAAGPKRVPSFPVPGVEPQTRFWVAVSQESAPTTDQRRAFEALAVTSAHVVNRSAALDRTAGQFHRLELAASLLPALLRVLDVREVFDSTTGDVIYA